MKFIQDIRCNAVLRAPLGVPIEQCRALPIRRISSTEYGPMVQSFWKPSEEELALLTKGIPIVLSFQGNTHPPVSLMVFEGD